MNVRVAALLSKSIVLAAFGLLFVACPSPVTDGGTTPDNDAGTGGSDAVVCSSVADCPDDVNWVCQGVCRKICASNSACADGEFCKDGYCAEGCATTDNCADPATQVCIDGECVDRGNAATCGDKCDCAPGEICQNEVCVAPPETCQTNDDCAAGPEGYCDAYKCNGFFNECVWPDAPPCDDDSDCVGRPGCSDATCTCTPNGQCVPDAGCTVETEIDDCGNGYYCNGDLVCDVLPACTNDNACAPYGLACNTATQQCERPVTCTSNDDCSGLASYCDLSNDPGACVVPTCINGGVTCEDGYICSQAGNCVFEAMGGACQSDADCGSAPWPDGEYCDTAQGMCAPGCRNGNDCPDPANQTCNGVHQCVQNPVGTGGQAGDACEETADCQSGLICKLFPKECAETCEEGCEPGVDCCTLTGYSQCEGGIILDFCAP